MKEKKLRGNPRRYQNLPYVKKSHMVALGLGDLGYSLVSGTVATYIMAFGTMVVGLSGALMGIAIAIGTIIDAISDPIVGHLSDNSKNRIFGKRHLWILIGLIGLMATSVFIWYVPKGLSAIKTFIWFAVGLTVLRTFNTFYFTPVGAFSVEVSNDYNERTTIQAFRSIGYIIGMILPVVIMGTFQNKYAIRNELGEVIIKGQFFAQGYRDFALVAVAVCFVTGVFMYIMTFSDIKQVRARQKLEETVKQKSSLKKVLMDFLGVLKSGDMRSIIFGYAISMVSATLIISLGFHVFTFTFELATTQMYILMGGLLVMTIVGQPLWPMLSKKYDKKRSMLTGLIISLIGCVLLFVCWFLRDWINTLIESNIALIILLPPLMIAGLGTGVLYSMPLALIGDAVVKNSVDDKSEKTGTYAGMMTFAYKISQSLTQLVSGILLSTIGFVEGSHVQSYRTSSNLGLILCIGITAVIIVGIIIFATMKLDKGEITRLMKEHEENCLELAKKEQSSVGDEEN
ncbi:MAG: MFS transporter [Clostridiales bacterium]|nr:MFS transporter [Clostridiales bacterium]